MKHELNTLVEADPCIDILEEDDENQHDKIISLWKNHRPGNQSSSKRRSKGREGSNVTDNGSNDNSKMRSQDISNSLKSAMAFFGQGFASAMQSLPNDIVTATTANMEQQCNSTKNCMNHVVSNTAITSPNNNKSKNEPPRMLSLADQLSEVMSYETYRDAIIRINQLISPTSSKFTILTNDCDRFYTLSNPTTSSSSSSSTTLATTKTTTSPIADCINLNSTKARKKKSIQKIKVMMNRIFKLNRLSKKTKRWKTRII